MLTSCVTCGTVVPAPLEESSANLSGQHSGLFQDCCEIRLSRSLRSGFLYLEKEVVREYICLLFLMYSEECHFLLKASMCFYTHSKIAVPRKEVGRVQGQAGKEMASCGRCFDDKREGMFMAVPDASSSTLPSESQGLGGRRKPTLGREAPFPSLHSHPRDRPRPSHTVRLSLSEEKVLLRT